MPLFNKNPNEVMYTGGKKHWAEVIKNSSYGNILIWRQPEEDFNTNSTLIVMPGEQAIFIKGGIIEQVFDNGTYKLSTDNYPFISRLRNASTGGISTFNCVVYFTKKTDTTEILWGTDTPIQVRDRVWGIKTDVRVRGAYRVRIENPAVFLDKLAGNNVRLVRQEELKKYFLNEFQGKIKSVVTKFLNSLDQELIGIEAYLDDLSVQITPYINEAFVDYGLKCVKFSLAAIDVDEKKYEELDKSQMKLIAEQRGYQSDRAGLDILGNDWTKVQGVKTMRDLMSNPKLGAIAGTEAITGTKNGVTGTLNSIAQFVFTPTASGSTRYESSGAQKEQYGRFSQQTIIHNTEQTIEDPVAVLEKLKRMLAAGLIEQSEYDAKKAEILSRM